MDVEVVELLVVEEEDITKDGIVVSEQTVEEKGDITKEGIAVSEQIVVEVHQITEDNIEENISIEQTEEEAAITTELTKMTQCEITKEITNRIESESKGKLIN